MTAVEWGILQETPHSVTKGTGVATAEAEAIAASPGIDPPRDKSSDTVVISFNSCDRISVLCCYAVRSKKEFNCEVRNKFEALTDLVEETVENHWAKIQNTWKTACTKVLGKREREQKEWMSQETWKKIETRRERKQEINRCQDQQEKIDLREQYREANREPVKDKKGRTITSDERQRTRWVEHFEEILNRPPPQVAPDITPAEEPLRVNTNSPTKAEIIEAIKSLKNGKAAGPDGIPPEALKADAKTTAEILHPLLQKIWEQEKVPADWKLGYLVKLPKKGDLSQCSNWRGIMLLSIPSKVLTRIILERLKKALDQRLRSEQAGFRQDRSCIHHIATLHIIIKQSIEWQTTVHNLR
ncbi:hypothetical protein MHYP_G00128970 [Metynnis hypsauchen]